MDIFFQDPSEIPLPPDEVRIRHFRSEPWPDRRRVRVYLEVDPFQKRPSAEIAIFNPEGIQVAPIVIIETMNQKMEMNLHLREANPGGAYTAQATLYYQASTTIQEAEGDQPMRDGQELPPPKIVDRSELVFEIPFL